MAQLERRSPEAQRAANVSATLSPRSCATTDPAPSSEDLAEVVIQQLGVAMKGVALAHGLVGEAEPGEVQHADPVLSLRRSRRRTSRCCSSGSHGRSTSSGRLRIAELGVEDLELGHLAAWVRRGAHSKKLPRVQPFPGTPIRHRAGDPICGPSGASPGPRAVTPGARLTRRERRLVPAGPVVRVRD